MAVGVFNLPFWLFKWIACERERIKFRTLYYGLKAKWLVPFQLLKIYAFCLVMNVSYVPKAKRTHSPRQLPEWLVRSLVLVSIMTVILFRCCCFRKQEQLITFRWDGTCWCVHDQMKWLNHRLVEDTFRYPGVCFVSFAGHFILPIKAIWKKIRDRKRERF